MEYKVLLIDDRHNSQSLESIKKMAKMLNINIVGERFHVRGMNILKNDTDFEYQAVILDATGFKESDVEENKETNSGLYYSLKFLNELKKTRIIPWFVYTGAPRNLKDENFVEYISEYQVDKKFGRKSLCYYTKTLHERELLDDIKYEIDRINETEIEYKYLEVFRICKKLNIPNEEIESIIRIIRSLQTNSSDLDSSLYFTQLRKFVEYVFRDAEKKGILHKACIDKDGHVNLTESSLFLAGEHTKYLLVKCKKAHFSKILAENIKNLLFITGSASHTSDIDLSENIDYQHYREQIKTPYLIYQLTYTICDLLIWYDNHIHRNPDYETNKQLWKEISTVGKIEEDGYKNFFCGDFILNKKYASANYQLGDKIKITQWVVNEDNRTKNSYPYYANKFERTT